MEDARLDSLLDDAVALGHVLHLEFGGDGNRGRGRSSTLKVMVVPVRVVWNRVELMQVHLRAMRQRRFGARGARLELGKDQAQQPVSLTDFTDQLGRLLLTEGHRAAGQGLTGRHG